MIGVPLAGARVLLIIGGGIAAYKSLELIDGFETWAVESASR